VTFLDYGVVYNMHACISVISNCFAQVILFIEQLVSGHLVTLWHVTWSTVVSCKSVLVSYRILCYSCGDILSCMREYGV